MSGRIKEIRDPIHVFIHVDENERRVLDSRPFQRLRNIHQLAMTYLVYPGASHRRFEHSLGVMHLAGQMYDVVTSEEKLSDYVRELIPAPGIQRAYWRMVLRIAALCHDMGHLPFSHAAEKELLPADGTHEAITRAIIFSDEMQSVWDSIRPKPDPTDICKLALGPEKASDLRFSVWEEILADLIAGDIFGSDRIDYLLRDSLHAGVAYGRVLPGLLPPDAAHLRHPLERLPHRLAGLPGRRRSLSDRAGGVPEDLRQRGADGDIRRRARSG